MNVQKADYNNMLYNDMYAKRTDTSQNTNSKVDYYAKKEIDETRAKEEHMKAQEQQRLDDKRYLTKCQEIEHRQKATNDNMYEHRTGSLVDRYG